MKQRMSLFPAIALPMVVLVLMTMAMMPMTASAAPPRGAKSHQKVHFFVHPSKQSHSAAPKVNQFAGNNLNYNGGPVMGGTTSVFAIFWEPTSNVSANYNNLLQRYFGDIGGSALYNNNTQYTDSGGNVPSNAVLAGAFVDNTPYPESPLLDSDIQNEVSNAQAINGWSSSINNVFFVFLEAGQDLCFDASFSQCASNTFCAYHSTFGANTIYAAMPYAASFSCLAPGQTQPNGDDADVTINVASHEQMEAATDPLLNAWFDASGQEIGDKCNFTFGPPDGGGGDITINGDPYEVQQEWDNAVSGCVMAGP